MLYDIVFQFIHFIYTFCTPASLQMMEPEIPVSHGKLLQRHQKEDTDTKYEHNTCSSVTPKREKKKTKIFWPWIKLDFLFSAYLISTFCDVHTKLGELLTVATWGSSSSTEWSLGIRGLIFTHSPPLFRAEYSVD